jgi:hypothetical protein
LVSPESPLPTVRRAAAAAARRFKILELRQYSADFNRAVMGNFQKSVHRQFILDSP